MYSRTDHRIFSHQNNTLRLTISSKALSNLVHLLRTDIVDGDDENGFVRVQQTLKLVEIACLITGFAPHIFLRLKTGCLRVKFGGIKWLESS